MWRKNDIVLKCANPVTLLSNLKKYSILFSLLIKVNATIWVLSSLSLLERYCIDTWALEFVTNYHLKNFWNVKVLISPDD